MWKSRKEFSIWRIFGCFCTASHIFLDHSTAQAFVRVVLPSIVATTRRSPISILGFGSTSLKQVLPKPSNDEEPNKYPAQKQEPQKRTGYKFGDLTKSLVNSVTGKEEYRFGDLTSWVGGQVGQKITGSDTYEFGDVTRSALKNYTGKSNYEFGDVTRSVLQNYTGKTTYEFGDLSKAVIQRIQSGQYDPWDVFLALRVLLAAGFTVFTPVAAILPVRLLLQLVNLGLAQEVSGRLVSVLAEHVDRRMKQAFTGNAKYALGDITKERLEQGLAKFTGKEKYELGDVSKAIQRIQKESLTGSKNKSKNQISLASDVLSALENFDPKKSK